MITISLVQKQGCENLRSVTTGSTSSLSRFAKANKIGLTCVILSASWGIGLAILTDGTPHTLNISSYPNSTKTVRGTHTVFFGTFPKKVLSETNTGISICLTISDASGLSHSQPLEIRLPRRIILQSTSPKTCIIRLLNEVGEVSTIPEDWQDGEKLHVALYQTLFHRLGNHPIAALRGGITTLAMSDWHMSSVKYETVEIPLSTAMSIRAKMKEQNSLQRSQNGECGEQLTIFGKGSQ